MCELRLTNVNCFSLGSCLYLSDFSFLEISDPFNKIFFFGGGSCLRCISRSQSRGTTADRSLACEDKLAFILVFFKHSAVKLQQLSSCLNSKQVVCASVQGFGVGVNFCSCHLLVEVCLGVARCLRSCHPWFTVFLPCCQ